MQKSIVSFFWPTDLLNPVSDHNLVVVGYKLNSQIVVIDYIEYSNFKKLNLKIEKNNLCLEIIGIVNFHHLNYRNFKFDDRTNKPVMESHENLILFKPPLSKKLEYYSINPISVDIFWTVTPQDVVPCSRTAPNKLGLHFGTPSKTRDLEDVMKFINLTEYTRYKLLQSHKTKTSLYTDTIGHCINWIGSFVLLLYCAAFRPICKILISVLSYPLWFNPETKTYVTLSTCSFVLHQLTFRAKQFHHLPIQFQRLRNSNYETEKLLIKGTRFSPSEYIKFYNSLWLILDDLLMGIIVSNLLSKYHNLLVQGTNALILKFEDSLLYLVKWLMNFPGGFKLNNELAEFFGELFMWVLDFWNEYVLRTILNNSSTIIRAITLLVNFGGLSMLIASIMDLLDLMSLHLRCFYFASTRVFNWQWHIIQSLFRLFYGKKYNILRNRIDSHNYEFDQLLFGIIIFTLLVYLLPTVVAFYLNFAVSRLLTLFLHTALEFVLVTLNHLPIVVLLLKAKHKERLPGGVIFECRTTVNDTHYFQLMARPLSLKEIINSHIRSMMIFNLNNLQEFQRDGSKANIQDVVNQWNRVSLVGVLKNIALGNFINSFDYKRLF
ncbi:hypothetical protein KL930_002716 [Ogataea haglerorum]|nr:hypothetical protein KL914_002327 [Ogataea haglerorum]KAG7778629.1 hypothetical protein KL930_002716 [Ogataea haglerorum]KAG7779315.1 hypothetical protein KL922_001800 [Ogataea haglerorum]